MELKIRYENEYQTIVLDTEATEQLWVSLSLEGDGISPKEREQMIQTAFEEQFNRPEYNIWHRETRYIDPTPKRRKMDGRVGYIQGDLGDPAFNIMDYLLTTSDVNEHESNYEYEEVCDKIRSILAKKPAWAEMFIAIRIEGKSIREYAARTGEDENNVSQKLKRAEKRLRENYPKRQI